MNEKDVARFWSRVNRDGPTHPTLGTKCWDWTGYKGHALGYGRLGLSNPRRNVWTHRASWELANGHIPEKTCVLHRCDRGCCVNPEHLFLGSLADNIHDMQSKGRHGFGETHSQSKLTDDAVRSIRARAYATDTIAALAREFQVARATIRRVAQRKMWQHVT